MEGHIDQSGVCQFAQQIPPGEVRHETVALPDRVHNPNYSRAPVPKEMFVPAVYWPTKPSA